MPKFYLVALIALTTLLPFSTAQSFEVAWASTSQTTGYNFYSLNSNAEDCTDLYISPAGNITSWIGVSKPTYFNTPCPPSTPQILLEFVWAGVDANAFNSGTWTFSREGSVGGTCFEVCPEGIQDGTCQDQIVESVQCEEGDGSVTVAAILQCWYDDGVAPFC